MNELIQKICERTGLTPDQANSALNVVVSHLKERLPAPIAAHVDGVLSGAASSQLGGLASQAESLAEGFFKKK